MGFKDMFKYIGAGIGNGILALTITAATLGGAYLGGNAVHSVLKDDFGRNLGNIHEQAGLNYSEEIAKRFGHRNPREVGDLTWAFVAAGLAGTVSRRLTRKFMNEQ